LTCLAASVACVTSICLGVTELSIWACGTASTIVHEKTIRAHLAISIGSTSFAVSYAGHASVRRIIRICCIRAGFITVFIVKVLVGCGCVARLACCSIIAISTLVHAIQAFIVQSKEFCWAGVHAGI